MPGISHMGAVGRSGEERSDEVSRQFLGQNRSNHVFLKREISPPHTQQTLLLTPDRRRAHTVFQGG
ncbi:hypothetical protein I7I50_09900 [Histoplasma capsulatum G186AR]|uniref:Uncharacterized protein n=1 Tax=Ajellomyces capsulatus TaxID=5037 RepID=A0A8H8D726_AJECA|nr:hypothetical protein I7I52_01138 [Histoplasma capsulatum]QSS68810.1 hypothetical protein I7I50_09900 [Histoplasma capsulatum G186AR]